MRRHITYANITATLALVLAMSGGALAAQHYLIHSTKQISPSVLRKLHGAKGAKGATGPAGAGGPEGKAGPRGPSAGLQAFVDHPGVVEGVERTIGTLAVPPGDYLANAKVTGLNIHAGREELSCKLKNDQTADQDISIASLESPGAEPAPTETLTLDASATMPGGGTWSVVCRASPGEVTTDELKIQAIAVGSVSNSPG